MRRLTAAIVLILALAASSALAAGGGQVSAGEGVVQATVSYPPPPASLGGGALPGLRLEISRSGQSFYAQPVSSRYCREYCGLESFGGGPLLVKDLEGDGEPDVVLELNTGGAHCCTVVQVFSLDPGVMAYRGIERDFGDPGAVLEDVAGDGRLELESADDRFAYAFTSYAFSGLPVQIWRISDARFVNVTRSFPRALRADAARQLKGFLANRRQGMGLGLIAAWAGDEYLLGHRSLVAGTLAREARFGRLRSGDHLSPGGGAFVRKLKRFLVSNGYA
jgi:hypothetical protein